MDIVVKGRRIEVPERFREHVSQKVSKLLKYDQKLIRVEVELSKERNPRQADHSDRIEITAHSKGPVIRAEAAATEKYAAFDMALEKLTARMRKAADRRRVHRGTRTPLSVAAATAPMDGHLIDAGATLVPGPTDSADGASPDQVTAVPEQQASTQTEQFGQDAWPESDASPSSAVDADDDADVYVERNGPMVVREKTHKANPMTRDQALYEMELVGHDFYLFVDATTKMPSVVYRRHGYDYGVIRLDV
ncbi:ribosome-associated translation inhibitor RaiA [Actinobacteria bacterium YIM 96077]|uniref:Ribosome hibernation promoting factor n=1 Tax=Phytoactinopolyspora halophila TaxID=1981511 RepID=A0A329R2A1_9ACTN|nr:ribosome-associated translation inhibitor RaiA [Phytoactinopolyspora halophila]AYY12066.1 ribosome-associated translation inhibitor RaiA [Actinobacteria bacterium YIM 96077]RAW18700.1 ribosome-associated translation inhibitor RaiA [Phytoactinopolyspora halophila]